MKVNIHQGSRALGVLAGLALMTLGSPAGAHGPPSDGGVEAFAQLDDVWPTPSDTRTGSGAPGPGYWQQKVDYEIQVTLDDSRQRLKGVEEISYKNNSPDTLTYLWVQLDQNRHAIDSKAERSRTAPTNMKELSYKAARELLTRKDYGAGHKILHVRDGRGNPLNHTIVDTVMRIDLPRPLEPGDDTEFEIAWEYRLLDVNALWGRGGYERLEDGLNLYQVAQWFPRMVAYTDYHGWQHKGFLGRGEFTLEFGDYRVEITVPDNHIVSATGELQNASKVLKPAWRKRLKKARKSREPVFIVTPEEAEASGKRPPRRTKTWVFEAENVRDFAWASCARFMWDAMGAAAGENTVMAMSFWPKEGEPIWSRYSTHAIAQALDVYSKMVYPYPYPVAQSVNGPVGGGMEYPMITFNAPRPEDDQTYSKRQKYGLISVIIHEIGHSWFPMIINTDERQWSWIDEGFNVFVQSHAEQQWEEDYPAWRTRPETIGPYMKRKDDVPIMTASDSLRHFGENAYSKTSLGLSILRETVLGPEIFDVAFQEYARRWAFKRPRPSDFFRTMEDASGVDLDWYWRGWFYSADHVDIGVDGLTQWRLQTEDPEVDKAAGRAERDDKPDPPQISQYEGTQRRVDRHPKLKDFYNSYDKFDVTPQDTEGYEKLLEDLEPEEKDALEKATAGWHYATVHFRNHGGVLMPLPLLVTYEDGSSERMRIPAEIWRRNAASVKKLFITRARIQSVALDPQRETADADLSNNHWPREPVEKVFKLKRRTRDKNPIQLKKEAEEKAKKEAEEKAKKEAEEKAKKEAEEKDESAPEAPAADAPGSAP